MTEWVKVHRSLQSNGVAYNNISSIIINADEERKNGNYIASAKLVGVARTLMRSRQSLRLYISSYNKRKKKKKSNDKLRFYSRHFKTY